MDKKPRKRGKEAYTRIPTLIYTTYFKEDKGRKIARGSYPFPLMSKGERNNKSMRESSEA
jgi:hypothetical protein